MSDPVALVTIHHEGDGTPTDEARGADGGYSAWIGATRYSLLRPPWVSWATLGFNHVSFDVCLSGNRMVVPVTDRDIGLIHAAFMDARAHDWVVPLPQVRDHHSSPGSRTVCPGRNTMARWNDVLGACRDVPNPHPPSTGEIMRDGYESKKSTPTRFRGAVVDLGAHTMTARGGANITPPLDPIEASSPWTCTLPFADDEHGNTRFAIVYDVPGPDDNAKGVHTVV